MRILLTIAIQILSSSIYSQVFDSILINHQLDHDSVIYYPSPSSGYIADGSIREVVSFKTTVPNDYYDFLRNDVIFGFFYSDSSCVLIGTSMSNENENLLDFSTCHSEIVNLINSTFYQFHDRIYLFGLSKIELNRLNCFININGNVFLFINFDSNRYHQFLLKHFYFEVIKCPFQYR